MRIIDSHVHLKHGDLAGTEYGADTIVRVMDAAGIEKSVVFAMATGAARAVGRVMRANPFPIIVPCHRVLGKGGRLAGYSAPGGLVLKARLLAHEGVTVQANQALPAGPAR